jgi:hypothetical protein
MVSRFGSGNDQYLIRFSESASTQDAQKGRMHGMKIDNEEKSHSVINLRDRIGPSGDDAYHRKSSRSIPLQQSSCQSGLPHHTIIPLSSWSQGSFCQAFKGAPNAAVVSILILQ